MDGALVMSSKAIIYIVCVHVERCVITSRLHRPAAAVCTRVSGCLWFVTQLLSSLVSPPQVPTPHFSIDSHPTLEDINQFAVCEVAADCKQVATFLGVEPSVISTADTDHPQQCEHACTDIFERWLSWKPGTGRKKRTWCTVLSAVEEAGHKAFSQQLQTEVLHLQ